MSVCLPVCLSVCHITKQFKTSFISYQNKRYFYDSNDFNVYSIVYNIEPFGVYISFWLQAMGKRSVNVSIKNKMHISVLLFWFFLIIISY